MRDQPAETRQCEAITYSGNRCGFAGSVEVEGHWLCRIHGKPGRLVMGFAGDQPADASPTKVPVRGIDFPYGKCVVSFGGPSVRNRGVDQEIPLGLDDLKAQLAKSGRHLESWPIEFAGDATPAGDPTERLGYLETKVRTAQDVLTNIQRDIRGQIAFHREAPSPFALAARIDGLALDLETLAETQLALLNEMQALQAMLAQHAAVHSQHAPNVAQAGQNRATEASL